MHCASKSIPALVCCTFVWQGECKLVGRVGHRDTGLVHDGPPTQQVCMSSLHASTRAFINAQIAAIKALGCYFVIHSCADWADIGCRCQALCQQAISSLGLLYIVFQGGCKLAWFIMIQACFIQASLPASLHFGTGLQC